MLPKKPPQIYLASSSPRRRELLNQINIHFETLSISLSEERKPNERAIDYARRLALEKAEQGWNSSQRVEDIPVLGADTLVVINGKILGKPKGREQGLEMLKGLSGHNHQVITSVAGVKGPLITTKEVVSTVTFRKLSDEEIFAYWEKGEGIDKAGAYAIQGIAAIFVKHLEGSYSNVMGLPLFETAELLKTFNVYSLS